MSETSSKPYKTKFPKNFFKTPGTPTLLNPGDLINLHKNSKLIMPIWLDGVHLKYTQICSPSTVAAVNFNIGQSLPSAIRIGAMLSRPTPHKNITTTPVFQMDLNLLNLATNLELLYHPIPSVRIKCHHQISPAMTAQEYAMSENVITVDHVGKQNVSSLVLSNVQLGQGRLVLSSMHSVTAGLVMGAEWLLELNKGCLYSQPAIAARYAREDFGYSATCSPVAFELFFWRQVHQNLHMGSMVLYNERTKMADGSLYGQWVYRDSTMRAMVNSSSIVGMTFTRRLGELSANLGVSLLVNMPMRKWTYGIKFDFDSRF